ncbi:MAG: YtxH domain-containing protein [Muribaculaceae bacterium]|nr:YtxH domain-containing protein [Muribaculaceae bacterium]
MKKALYIALAAAGGLAIGAAAGMLFAPEKGSDTRKNVARFIKKNCPFVKSEKQAEMLAEELAAELQA